MRFHMGISFSWKTIKKFLLPILLGLLAYFGFNFIYENNKDFPLGFIKVNALENYDTRFDLSYSGIDRYIDFDLDINHTKLTDLVNTLNSNSNITREYTLIISSKHSYIYAFVYDPSTNYSFNFYGNNYNNFAYKFSTDNNYWGYRIAIDSTSTDFYSNGVYSHFITCVTGGNCSNLNQFNTTNNLFFAITTISNISNDTMYFKPDSNYLIYYSTKDLIINNTYGVNENEIFYKSIYLDNEPMEVGTKFITYYDYITSHPVEPEPEPTPDEDIEHKAIFNKIYWFDDNTTSFGVLCSIYILLFLYTISMIFLRILTIIKNTRWK